MKSVDRYNLHDMLTTKNILCDSLLIEIIKHEENINKVRSLLPVVFIKSIISCFIAIFKSILEVTTITFSKNSSRDRALLGKHKLYLVPNEINTTSKHVYTLKMDSHEIRGFMGYTSPFSNKRVDSNIYLRDARSEFYAIFVFLMELSEILKFILKCNKEGLSINIKSLTVYFLRLIRGISINGYIRNTSIETVVFALSGNATTSFIELTHRKKPGLTTLHWVHGVGLGYNFDSYADYQVVNNSYDADFYKNGLNSKVIFFPYEQSEVILPKLEDFNRVYLFSNLVHPSNKYFKKYGWDKEIELIHLLKEAGFNDIYLKFHPVVKTFLLGRYEEYLDIINKLGVKILYDFPNKLDNGIVISTISTTFIDLLKLDVSPLLFDQYGDDNSMFQFGVGEAFKFHNHETLIRAVNNVKIAVHDRNFICDFLHFYAENKFETIGFIKNI